MSEIVQLVSTLTPKPGKIEESIEKIAPYNAWVQANEPGCLRYEIFRSMQGDSEVLVILEVFKDKEAREYHRTTNEHLHLLKSAAEEGLLACAPDIKELKLVAGFDRRG